MKSCEEEATLIALLYEENLCRYVIRLTPQTDMPKTHHRHKVGDALYQRAVLPHGLANVPYGVSVNFELHVEARRHQ